MTDSLNEAQLLLNQQKTITGYQYKSNGRYNGKYEFPNNLDSLEIHLPPMTTLVAPPDISTLPAGMEHSWNGNAWVQVPWTKPETIPVEVAGAPKIIPMPEGKPVANEHGVFPITRLNADGSAYEWFYPPKETHHE